MLAPPESAPGSSSHSALFLRQLLGDLTRNETDAVAAACPCRLALRWRFLRVRRGGRRRGIAGVGHGVAPVEEEVVGNSLGDEVGVVGEGTGARLADEIEGVTAGGGEGFDEGRRDGFEPVAAKTARRRTVIVVRTEERNEIVGVRVDGVDFRMLPLLGVGGRLVIVFEEGQPLRERAIGGQGGDLPDCAPL